MYMANNVFNHFNPNTNSSGQQCDIGPLKGAAEKQLEINRISKTRIEISVQTKDQNERLVCKLEKPEGKTQGLTKTKCNQTKPTFVIRKKSPKPPCNGKVFKPGCYKKPTTCETKKPSCPLQTHPGHDQTEYIGNTLLVKGKGFKGEDVPSFTKPPRELNLPGLKLYDNTQITCQTKSDPNPVSNHPPAVDKHNGRNQNRSCNKKAKKPFKGQTKPKPTWSEHFSLISNGGITVVTVRDQCCSTTNFKNEYEPTSKEHPKKAVERTRHSSTPPPRLKEVSLPLHENDLLVGSSPPKEGDLHGSSPPKEGDLHGSSPPKEGDLHGSPSPKGDPSPPKPELVSRASSAVFLHLNSDKETQDDIREPVEPVIIFEKLPEKDLKHFETQTDLKQLLEDESQTDLKTTQSNFCQTDNETMDNYCQTDETDEQEQIQKLMHLIPIPVDVFERESQTQINLVPNETQTQRISFSEVASQVEMDPVDVGTSNNCCQTQQNTDDDFCQTDEMDILSEEKDRLQNMMHLIPLPAEVVGSTKPNLNIPNSLQRKPNPDENNSNMSTAISMKQSTGTCASKTPCKPKEPDRCNDCNQTITEIGCGCGSGPQVKLKCKLQCTPDVQELQQRVAPSCGTLAPKCPPPTNAQRCVKTCQAPNANSQWSKPPASSYLHRMAVNGCVNPYDANCKCGTCAKKNKTKRCT